MKIISGKYKGRIINGFNMIGTRPTMERVKESLFAIINLKLQESIILDLFSGSGNLGIESLSEGAKYAYLVDKNKKAANIIKKNCTNLNILNYKLLNMDYVDAIKYIKNENQQVDIIFLDPPYDTNYIEKSIIEITKNNILKENGLIVCETDDLNKILYDENYEQIKEKKYGDKWIVIIKKIW